MCKFPDRSSAARGTARTEGIETRRTLGPRHVFLKAARGIARTEGIETRSA